MDVEQYKQKYASAPTAVRDNNVRLDHLHVQGDAKNRAWDAIKAADPSYSDLMCDLAAPAAQSAGSAGQNYTVQPGDTVSRIARHFYGSANAYMKIFEANRDQLDNPDKIKVWGSNS